MSELVSGTIKNFEDAHLRALETEESMVSRLANGDPNLTVQTVMSAVVSTDNARMAMWEGKANTLGEQITPELKNSFEKTKNLLTQIMSGDMEATKQLVGDRVQIVTSILGGDINDKDRDYYSTLISGYNKLLELVN